MYQAQLLPAHLYKYFVFISCHMLVEGYHVSLCPSSRPQRSGWVRVEAADIYFPLSLLGKQLSKIILIMEEYWMIILGWFSAVLPKNVCYGYLLEVPWKCASNEYPEHSFYGERSQNIITKYSSITSSLLYSEKGSTLTFASHGNKFFPFRVDPFSEGGLVNWKETGCLPPL